MTLKIISLRRLSNRCGSANIAINLLHSRSHATLQRVRERVVMWNKIIIGTLATFALAACGQAVGESPSTSDKAGKEVVSSGLDDLIERVGALPDQTPPPKIKSVQNRTAALLNLGLIEAYFSEDVSDPDEMLVQIGGIGQSSGWEMGPSGRRLFLVKRHLKPVSEEKKNSFDASLCDSGSLYSGYVAARPYTRETVTLESLLEVTASPYGVLVCDREGGIDIKLVQADDPVLE